MVAPGVTLMEPVTARAAAHKVRVPAEPASGRSTGPAAAPASTEEAPRMGPSSTSTSTPANGLRSLSPEDKARVGQLIKVLAQERREKENFRQQLDLQSQHLQRVEKERENGRQQERALITRVSRSLQLLREYQQELRSSHTSSQEWTSKRSEMMEVDHSSSVADRSPPAERTFATAESAHVPRQQAETCNDKAPKELEKNSDRTEERMTATLGSSHMTRQSQVSSTGGLPKAQTDLIAAPTTAGEMGQQEVAGCSQVVRAAEPSWADARQQRNIPAVAQRDWTDDARHQPCTEPDCSNTPRIGVHASPPESPASSIEEPRCSRSKRRAASRSASRSRQTAGDTPRGGKSLTPLGILQPSQLSLLQRYLHIQQGSNSTLSQAAAAVAAAAASDVQRASPSNGQACWKEPERKTGLLVVTPASCPVLPTMYREDPQGVSDCPASRVVQRAKLQQDAHIRPHPVLTAPPPVVIPTPSFSPASKYSTAATQTITCQHSGVQTTPCPEQIVKECADVQDHITSRAGSGPHDVDVNHSFWTWPDSEGDAANQRSSLEGQAVANTNLVVQPLGSIQQAPARESLGSTQQALNRETSESTRQAPTKEPLVATQQAPAKEPCGSTKQAPAREPLTSIQQAPATQTLGSTQQEPAREPFGSTQQVPVTATAREPITSLQQLPREATPPLTPRRPWVSQQSAQSPEPLMRSPSLPRTSINGSCPLGRASASRRSWPGPLADGYYSPSMFELLDSVENALTQSEASFEPSTCSRQETHTVSANDSRLCGTTPMNSTLASDTTSGGGVRSQCAAELSRLQHELSDLERLVYGSAQAHKSAGSSKGSSKCHSPHSRTVSREIRNPWQPSLHTHSSELPLARSHAPPLAASDVAVSTPPRRSREFDLGTLWDEPSRLTPDPSEPCPRRTQADPLWPARKPCDVTNSPRRVSPGEEEIDDVLCLLRSAPPTYA